MINRSLFILGLLLVSFWSYGQTWNQFKKEAKRAYENQEYDHALYYLDTMQKIDSAKFNFHFLQAEAARFYNAFELSEGSYKKVLAEKDSKNLLAATFGLAVVQKMQGKYEGAIKGFNDYLKMNPDTNHTYHKDAIAQIQACKWAMELIKFNDKDLEINQLDKKVNTDFSDFAPVFYQDKLLFSSLRFKSKEKKKKLVKKYSKILELGPDDKEAIPFELGLTDNEKHTAHAAFTKNGNRVYFNICNYSSGSKIQCKIYVSKKLKDNTWGMPTILPESINASDKTTTQPNIGYDENLGKEMLFFASDRLGGKGGLDLWMSYLNEAGEPSNPINLASLNTEKNDLSPFFHNYTQTLYFSSNGRKSLGGHDIYKTTFQNEKWQEVLHTGYPLNSSYNDVYFSLNHIGSEGYFASNREGTRFLDEQISACCYDIFKAEFNSYLLDLNVLTYLQTDDGPVELDDVTVSVYEIFENAEQSIAHKIEPEGNSHLFRINSNKKYKIVAEKKDFFPSSMEFNTETPIEGDRLVKKIALKPLKLNILTFTDEPPMDPLSDVNLTILEIDENGNQKELEPLYDPVKNSVFYPLLSDKKYVISAYKEGYDPVNQEFETYNWESISNILTKELILPRAEEKLVIRDLKPFSLYFDNDAPKAGISDTTTDLTYATTLAAYQNRKEEFKREYAKGKTGQEKEDAIAEMDSFFELDMIKTHENFIKFTKATLERLELGRNITISVQGYASPLASEAYNLKLTKRRIRSMYNFYSTFENGAMKEFVDNGRLVIRLIPRGESDSPEGISDNPRDRKNSVFGLDASKQRRVEIKGAESSKNRKERS